jgi:hypothetical protein
VAGEQKILDVVNQSSFMAFVSTKLFPFRVCEKDDQIRKSCYLQSILNFTTNVDALMNA